MPKLEELLAENERLKAELKHRDEVLRERDEKVAQLEYQLEYLRKKLFGTGRSEKLDARQQELLLGQIEELEKELESATSVPAHNRRKRAPLPTREERFAHLPVEETVEIIPEEVAADPDAYERTEAVEETFEVDYHPPRFFRRRLVRPKHRRKDQPDQPLVVAPAKPRVVEGIASANLVALILIAKFIDHLPLYRQAKTYRRHGCDFSLKSMVRWVGQAAEWLRPIYDHMAWELLQGNYLQADETPVNFCDPDLGLKKTKQGFFCVYSRPDDNVVFVWRRGRSGADVTGFLDGYVGLLQTDAYAPYLSFAREHPQVTLLGCMAHVRRKFFEARDYQRRECDLVLAQIAKLYQIEKEIREAGPLAPEQVEAIRQRRCPHCLARLKRSMEIIQRNSRPQDPVRKACNYALGIWKSLTEYVYHGEARIDNNLVENAIRPTAVGKKNWLFIGHPDAGDRATIIYSILISCQRFGIDPQQYLRFVFEQDTRSRSPEQIAAITPRAYAQAVAAAQAA